MKPMHLHGDTAWLLCLDVRTDYLTPEHPLFAPAAVEALPALHTLLGHARSTGWRVMHSVDARRRAATVKGLEPRPDEAVFKRMGVSAFTSAPLRARAEADRPLAIFLAGFGLATSGLATLIVGAELGLSMILVEDAFAAAAVGDRTADEIARVVMAIAPAFGTLTTADVLDIDRARVVSLRRGHDDNDRLRE
ncbi:MAG TPA: isochorismatase family protein [Planctomycetota bacterium]|nr:isochorismatase family protein [Planctomycetota bacterium]